MSLMGNRISIDPDRMGKFCRRWKVSEIALFGSALHENFRDDSDVDLLISFSGSANWSLLDHVAMEEDLSAIMGRKVDLISRSAVERSENWIRRNAILSSLEPVYAAGRSDAS